MTNLDSILKSRDITLPTKVCLVKAMVFPVVMYGCESWTVKKAEHRKIGGFELRCWRLLRVPWTARRSSQSILKEIRPGCSLEGLMLKLKLRCFGHRMWRTDSLEKTLMLRGIWGQEDKGMTEDEMAEWHHRLNRHESESTPGVGDGQGGLGCCDSWGRKESDTNERLNWTEMNPFQATVALLSIHSNECTNVGEALGRMVLCSASQAPVRGVLVSENPRRANTYIISELEPQEAPRTVWLHSTSK